MKFKIIETKQRVDEAGGKVAKTAQVAGVAAKGILSGLEGLANLVGMKTGLYDKVKGVVKGFVDFGKQVIDVMWKNRKYSEEEKRIIDAIIKDPTNSDLIHCLSAYGNPLSQTWTEQTGIKQSKAQKIVKRLQIYFEHDWGKFYMGTTFGTPVIPNLHEMATTHPNDYANHFAKYLGGYDKTPSHMQKIVELTTPLKTMGFILTTGGTWVGGSTGQPKKPLVGGTTPDPDWAAPTGTHLNTLAISLGYIFKMGRGPYNTTDPDFITLVNAAIK